MLGVLVNFKDAVEWVPAAGAGLGLFLGPFVDEGQGDSEIGSNRFGAAFLERLLEDFMRFHRSTLGRIAGTYKHRLTWISYSLMMPVSQAMVSPASLMIRIG